MTEDSGRERTLHQRILGDIEGRIVSGEWPPGHRLPFEMELAAQYGCSRMTVNKVMTQLAKSGLIERRRKSGSFVTQPQAQSAVLEITDIEAEVRSLNLAYGFRLMKRALRKAGEEELRLIDVAEGAPLLALSCVHMAGPRPFCREERLISLAAVPEAETADFTATPPGQWLIGQVPWSAAEHRIRAVNAGADMAAALAIAKGAACLVVERRTWSGQGAVTQVCLTYPGDSHTLMARFTPASQ
ncbi:histidine utilization repressor [Rhizobium rhizosphaerae]|uniref:Histidine utilization repressor n=1 Tax=Xaviernesmea rhizosphaerae TaxID=1672749 RepID=A0ABX3PF60_9HYPH|nr:histidine utilization repressor [Xaviernesmea rhizosphaerae]OQP86716.1 histidine utilization repressor [Xaviernesmea rhizosphaerae]